MAAQRDPTGKIGKQVGWLNRNKSFANPILFTKVVGPLSQVDITSAMAILKDVEQQAEQIPDPTAYVLEAAAACPAAQRTTTRLSIDGTQKEIVVQMDPTGKIGRQISWQNRNVTLMQPINPHEVLEPLSMIDVTTAMSILKELESKAAQVMNPTEWIRTSAAKAAAESGTEGSAFVGALDPTGKISRQVAWLNKNAPLATPLVFGDVVQPLSQLDIVSAMSVLKNFESQAANISDASAWIFQAAEKAAAQGGALPEGGLGGLDPTGKISRQVNWLNSNVDLASPISFADVAAPLSRVDITAAMTILKECEDQASNLRDPTGFIVTAAQKAPAAGRGGSSHSTAGAPMDPTGKIRRTVNWINGNVALAEPLDVESLVERLSEVELSPALRILKDVEENHANIKNPTNFVLAASNRLPKPMAMYGGCGWGSGPMMGGAIGGMPATRPAKRQWTEEPAAPGDDEGSKAISKEVGKLNREIGFPEKLSYSDVKGHLEALGSEAAMKILQDLRQSGRGVSNPTAYVIAAAKRSANGEEAPPKRPRSSTGGGMVGMGSMGAWGGMGGMGSMGSWGKGGKGFGGVCGGGMGGKGAWGGCGWGGAGGKGFAAWG